MRVQRSVWYRSWVVLVCTGLAACSSNDPPPPAFDSLGNYQPASLTEAVLFRNRTAVENFLALGVDPNEAEPDGTVSTRAYGAGVQRHFSADGTSTSPR